MRIKYIMLAVLALLLASAFSAHAAEYDWFGTLPKTYTSTAKKNPKILFVGNSHTFKNNMPEMFRRLCSRQGIYPQITTVVKGGHSLYEYLNPDRADSRGVYLSSELKRLLKTQKWDFVVLQDRSYEAVANPDKMKQAVKELSALVRQAGAKPVLYMTWAPEKGHYSYKKFAGDKAKTPNEYLLKVKEMYYSLAESCHTALSPAGIAFRRGQKIFPDIELYSGDGLHASAAGSYLSACVMYATIFGKSPEGNSYYPSALASSGRTGARVAGQLQALAADVTVRGGMASRGRIRFTDTSVTLAKGKRIRLGWQIFPSASVCRVTGWQSSDSRIVSVSDSGIVTARRAGTAVITVRLNNNHRAACAVTVTKNK